MLIDFEVENFRSIKNPVLLSAVARGRSADEEAKLSTRPHVRPDDQIAHPHRLAGRSIELLPALGIFGANASGKSNVLRAMNELLVFITWTSDESAHIRLKQFVPFRLNPSYGADPTRFELRTGFDEGIFIYSLVCDHSRILVEHLSYIPSSSSRMSPRLLFNRERQSDGSYEIKNGSDLGNSFRGLQKSLKEQVPFLRYLCRELEVPIVRPLSDWLQSRWLGISIGTEYMDRDFSSWMVDRNPNIKSRVVAMMRQFDTGIDDIEVHKLDTSDSDDEYRITVIHQTEFGPVKWDIEEESTGTQRLFSLACKLIDAFDDGSLLLVDELGSNVHPHITRTTVKLFQSEKINPRRAQLIFSSHDNTLQKNNLLRRDQIWFTQKQGDGSTELYPLTDYRPRNDIAIDRAYLDGRYGAVPVLPSDESFILAPLQEA